MSQLTTIVTAGSMGATLSLTGDSGGPVTPDGGGNIDVLGGSLPGAITSNITTVGNGSPNTLAVSLNNDVTLSGFLYADAYVSVPATTSEFEGTFVYDGNSFLHGFGVNNVFLGTESGNFTLSGTENTAVGAGTLFNLTDGVGNTSLGYTTLGAVSTGDFNTGIGQDALAGVTTGNQNVGLGFNAGNSVNSGSFNIILGSQAGTSIGTASSSNIYLGNTGASESNTIRIGNQGSGDYQQNRAFIAGIHSVTPAGATQTVIIDSNGQLGSSSSITGFVWNEETGTSASMAVRNGYIANNAGLVTLTLPASAAIGDIVRVTGKGAGGWRIAQNAGQTIYFGTSTTTTGAAGRLDSTATRDTVELVCVTANNDWNVLSSIGNITVT